MNIKATGKTSAASSPKRNSLYEVGSLVKLTKDVKHINSLSTIQKGTQGMISHIQKAEVTGTVFYTVTLYKTSKWLTVEENEIQPVR